MLKNTLSVPVQAYFFSKRQEEQCKKFHEIDLLDPESGESGPYRATLFNGKEYSEQCTVAPGEPIKPFGSWEDWKFVGTDPELPKDIVELDF